MAVFRVEKTKDFTIMCNHHLRNTELSLKAKGLLSLMLSLPEDWDYTTKGLAHICKDGVDSITTALKELERHGYLTRQRLRYENGQLGDIESCDALWVSEAIGNIVKNALEHTENGGHIEVKWSQSPLMTQIEISDDGKGIHPEDLYNIFKRFYRSRFSSDVHGIGLGLPLAKSIVEAHGGTISVTSSLGAGTTFTLNFFNLTDE